MKWSKLTFLVWSVSALWLLTFAVNAQAVGCGS
jgi:hypothetical protein